jgi:hypothetical protein
MFAPQALQGTMGHVREWNQAIHMTFAAPNMHLFALCINIPHL